ncbi:sigma-54-dependent transcriptional regulator [Vulgatibacter incomptus]|uniref:Response regulator of zinc sigma-54-dependent two-component system n=1 Tax=Vulgatibacter incomptus TaxID=1391653 RepID=A0A0K1P828_9BACT|nr:sigma-54 dependent transcriptional regulator [Vulgatibacter incomptus]AKU89675.1 Response regulator of zinc sigma-54-dependent two-component system [Vulgatibacter incomptus]
MSHERPPGSARILVVDDQKNMRATTAIVLRQDGYVVEESEGGEEALRAIDRGAFDLVLTDLRMEPLDGLAMLRRVQEVSPATQVVVMTAYGTIETAVEAMRLGAADYLSKPFKESELLVRVGKALEKQRLLREVTALAGEFRERYGLESIVGQSAPLREMLARIVRVAPTETTVLITGESGTGKELVARAIHAASGRAKRSFVAVNCAALTASLLESELFGHAKGAFTGAVSARRGLYEEAEGGTLMLDEIGETDVNFQAKLLRALQEREIRRVGESRPVKVDVRVVAATNQDLRLAISEKRFREDLFYRLNVVPIRVPPLRERLSDVPLLAAHFLAKFNRRNGATKELGESAIERLLSHDFPGNVRELENLVEQAAALSAGDRIGAPDFDIGPAGPAPSPSSDVMRLSDVVDQAERAAIAAAMERNPGDLAAVARELGVSPTTLWRKSRRLGLG